MTDPETSCDQQHKTPLPPAFWYSHLTALIIDLYGAEVEIAFLMFQLDPGSANKRGLILSV